ncbi:MAG: GntR family transcriptional regulator [Candidatus Fimivivens sp.]
MYLTERFPRETGRDYALRTLKENIIRLSLEPGSMVSENELALEMGLSRTPVREALIELSKVKIVEIYPQKGSMVALIDYNLVEESLFMRRVLELAVVELDCAAATPEDLNRLRENVRLQAFYINDNDGMLLHLDDQFHKMLFEIAQKPQVFTLMRNIAIHFDRVRNITLSDVMPANVIQAHGDIVEAIANRDPAAARRQMAQHLDQYRSVEKSVRERFPHYFKSVFG